MSAVRTRMGGWWVTPGSDSVNVMFVKVGRSVAVANADRMPDGSWWLARLKVEDPELRGKGLGRQVMERLQEVLAGELLVVAPGGYGSDVDRLRRFYARCGFVERPDGMMAWGPVGKKAGGTVGPLGRPRKACRRCGSPRSNTRHALCRDCRLGGVPMVRGRAWSRFFKGGPAWSTSRQT